MKKQILKKKIISLSKSFLIFVLITSWIFSGFPPVSLVIDSKLPLKIPEVQAAVARNSLTSSADSTDATSYTTASITPSSNCLVVALVANSTNNSATTPTLSGNGLTWTQVDTRTDTGTNSRRVTAFRAMGAAPSAGAVTIDFAGTTQSGAEWEIDGFCSVDTSGTGGSGAVVQSTNNGVTSGTSLALSLANFGATNNAGVSGFFAGTTSLTPKVGWYETLDTSYSSPTVGFETQFSAASSTRTGITWSGSGVAGGVALEIKSTTTANVILLWDSSVGPTPTYDGWTCISCNPGDAFYEMFFEASTTYDGQSYGATTSVTHVLTYSSQTAGANDGGMGSSGSSKSTNSHTHTFTTPTFSADDILPLHKRLRVIQKVNPTTLPANIIAMFDVATSSMPTGWTDYSNMGGRFLYGQNDNGTGGSTSHTATTSAVFTSGAGSGSSGTSASGSDTTAASHTHTLAAASATDSANNNPLFGTVTFGKLTATSSFLYPGMIAMFDQTPPSGWTTYSSSSAVITGNLIKGGSSYGSTGGSATQTHSHSNVTWTSSTGSGTNQSVGGGATTAADASHTHTATFSVSTIISYPPNKGVILGQKNIYFEQSGFRAFNNANSADVGTVLAALNTAGTLVASNDAFRLRMLMHVATGTISLDPAGASSRYFKLQFVGKGSGSCASPSGGTPSTYTDVTGSTAIAFNDNAAVADGAALTANANDPTHVSDTTVNELYEEANNFGASTTVASKQDGMWDFSLKDNSAPGSTAYCFRIVESDATVFDTYSFYPQITTAAAVSTYTQQLYQWFLNENNLQPGSSKQPQNIAITDVDTGNLNRLRIRILVSTADLSASGQNFILQYKTVGAGCSASETWSLVDNATSTAIWKFYDNTVPSDGTAISSSLLSADVLGSYEEIVTFTNPNAISKTQTGEWDFPMSNNGATANTVYCFRVAKADATALDTYTNYPQVTTSVTSGARAGGGGSNAPSVTETVSTGGTGQGGGSPTDPPAGSGGVSGGGTGQGGGGESP